MHRPFPVDDLDDRTGELGIRDVMETVMADKPERGGIRALVADDRLKARRPPAGRFKAAGMQDIARGGLVGIADQTS